MTYDQRWLIYHSVICVSLWSPLSLTPHLSLSFVVPAVFNLGKCRECLCAGFCAELEIVAAKTLPDARGASNT